MGVNDLQIRLLDPAADSFGDDIRRWYDAYLASVTHGDSPASPYRFAEISDLAAVESSHRWCGAWLATGGDQVVGTGWLDLPTADNLHLATADVQVVPAMRRRGVGTAVAAELESFVRGRGRTVVIAEVDHGLEVSEDDAIGVAFARSQGYEVALGDIQRRMPLPVAAELLDALAAEAAPFHRDYAIETFHGRVPDRLVAGFAALAAQLYVEAPAGDLELEAEDSSIEGWRDREAACARQGLTMWHAVALSPSEEVVAYSTVAVSAHDRELCHQWGTLVRPDHRGHRLGLATKVANHRELQAAGAPAREVVTWNAGVNAHMIGVNEQLGFHRVGRLTEVQKRL